MTKILILRTNNSDNRAIAFEAKGFQYPNEIGATVEAPDWQPTQECGHGLHGLAWGEGGYHYLSWDKDAKWLVIETDTDDGYVDLDDNDKCKFQRGIIRHIGDRKSATDYLYHNGGAGKAIVGASVIVGYNKIAVVGARGTATAGDYGTAVAGVCGTAIAGECGTAIVGNHGTAIAGYRGTAIAGHYGTAIAGTRGKLAIDWGDVDGRPRTTIGYTGENGIEPDVAYKCDPKGKLVKA